MAKLGFAIIREYVDLKKLHDLESSIINMIAGII